ncbi:Uncharacterized membrane anchored protein Mext_4159 [hydrothermal vent metagenome]|uniref:Uncharacterized membrane anchored protein Mext_4159 n=1 Tax=hydrothermal vent metagenome TaxID=652676 RepID=A0A3B0RGP6_9ZZZZ
MLRKLRTYFLAGLVVTAPIGITIWLTWSFVSLFDKWFKPFLPEVYNPDTYLPFSVPGIGLIVGLFMITVIGAFAANLVGKTLLSWWENLLNRMPIVPTIYRAVKQIFQTALSQKGTNFKQVGLIEYPRRGVHVVVFVARELDSGEIGLPAGTAMYSAFMPTTPNPTSGFLFFLEKHEVTILDLSVEEGAKLVISAGLVTPAQAQAAVAAEHGNIDAETAEKLKRDNAVSD